jgi:hypothetical protein
MPDRIRLSRAKGWRMPEGTVKVDRATIWGNPWRVGMPGKVLLPRQDRRTGWQMEALTAGPIDAAHAVTCYRNWLAGDPLLPAALNARGVAVYRSQLAERRAHIVQHLPELRGRSLACWCALDAPCHADVLLELANA